VKPTLPADPGPPHALDLCRVLVLGVPPWPGLGLIPEATFAPQSDRYVAGVYRARGGRRIAVAVDPAADPGAFAIEDALTGRVVRAGKAGERL
jgi:hypothetical protein